MTLAFTPKSLAKHDIKITKEVVKRIQDKIKGEIDTARKLKGMSEIEGTEKMIGIFDGKIQFGEDLKQWIKDNIRET